MKTILLRTIPILGWLFLGYGAARSATGRPLRHPVARFAWWLDAFLSVIVHAAQIPTALRTAAGTRPPLTTAILTMVFGMTWWKTQHTKETTR